MQGVYISVLLSSVIILSIFQVISISKYRDFFLPLDKKEYSYKVFLPGCLGIVEVLKLAGSGRYQAMLSQKIVMLHGNRYSSYYTKVHWSSKIFYLLLGVFIGSFLCFAGKADYTGLFIIPAFGAGLFFLADKELEDKLKERRLKLQRYFPDFLSKLVLLVNAGLNVRQAIERIVMETQKDTPLYQELNCVITDIHGGTPENEAYSDFAERCKIKEITNFVSILQQNMKLGGSQMLFELRRMGTECWEMRKSIAKQLGEAASSKLMIPLSIMFLAIILICVAPVILEFRSAF